MVTELLFDEEKIEIKGCVLEAVMTKNVRQIDWRLLKDASIWKQGWH